SARWKSGAAAGWTGRPRPGVWQSGVHRPADPEPLRRALTLAHPLDVGADVLQLLLDPLVAAVDVVHAPDLGLTARDETGHHETGGRAQVARHHRRAGELLGALDDRARALAPDARAEADQLGGVDEPLGIDLLGDHR